VRAKFRRRRAKQSSAALRAGSAVARPHIQVATRTPHRALGWILLRASARDLIGAAVLPGNLHRQISIIRR
jgi:hypothetical protein